MAKAKIDLKKMSKALRKRFDDFLETPDEQKKLVRTLKSELISNLRSGEGSDDKPLPQLKQSTIDRRIKLSQLNKTDSRYKPSKSNVTFTGKFVRSLVIMSKTVKRTFRKNVVTFEFEYKGSRPTYKTSNKRRKRKTVENSEIFKGLTKRGWKLAGATKGARIRITKQFRRFIRRRER